MRVTYNKLDIIRTVRYFNEYTDEDRGMALYYLGEELIENAKRLDKFLSDENGGFDPNNEKHVRLFAKIDQINDELSDLNNTARV